ncbi:ABC transporter ATP-binding protein/permease [Clostridium botulinum]|uniref:ABC transporter, ATP-binding/permease protein n=1 Tax=Clostridium botulinum (strain Okra / Type B1) TaxID=498213 RepID=B1IHB4_CLOBK|nr:ABC transporter ATP-binding protein/permease [Clostridium botulinum]ACA45412.1 ABC transporter, ATP-binding/permease protein [Clostridium botulinum B1 str. Okra]MBD5564552.1 ABC transporter ATP-binding protein/permease [Clostridium botulinum]MBD5565429.1 ABC transporter ATP-binding protein/permease [Clostridium botulinum]MBD5570565.1 ABC transporter ATP-binding protein/permease [Clostridium botulinum]MBD5574915.1 ABC transporter ATP-binding protein/permease [Clostridium botulinum]
MLQIKDLKKVYTTGEFKQTALDGVSIDFRQSEFVAILGPSGSGKTTLLNMLGGLDQYDSGNMIINGLSTKKFGESDWDTYRNNSVGFIFQSYNLIPHLSIVDNVEMGMTLSGVPKSEKRQKATYVLEKVGLGNHIHKKPNQLSGGQMQRVAIARALANDPEIILADEPTGALDTQTSEQIMDLIKEIAKDKLVIMVTHNPELAEEYADRIVSFSDGKIISDTNPFVSENNSNDYKPKKTSMNFLTALKLSGNNIVTKKWRTALTAFASSIGIIGVALVLSLSNGFNKQINEFEKDSLSNYPISIEQNSMSLGMSPSSKSKDKEKTEFPNKSMIYPYDSSKNAAVHANAISTEYVDYIKKIDSSLINGISYTRNVNMNILKKQDGKVVSMNTSAAAFSTYPSKGDSFETDYLKSYYDVLKGSYPKNEKELVLVVDKYNQVDTNILEALGFSADSKNINFDSMIGTEYKLIYNDDYYTQSGKYFTVNGDTTNLENLYNNKNAVTLKISGIIRIKEDANVSNLSTGIVYSDQLAQDFIENAKNSKIVLVQKEAKYNVMNGNLLTEKTSTTTAAVHGAPSMTTNITSNVETKDDVLASLGATSSPTSISIYPVNFEAKDNITNYLDDWNKKLKEEDQIVYTDMASMITSLTGNIMDGITIVLVAFAGISLVVSMIMIGIIIYISVLERTKEIGVLRALGARKKDITRVFNAETFIIGFCSGGLGIAITYLLTIPVNSILYKFTDLNNVAQLNPLHAIALVITSIVLTMIGGAIPSKMAAKKDPVIALRSE